MYFIHFNNDNRKKDLTSYKVSLYVHTQTLRPRCVVGVADGFTSRRLDLLIMDDSILFFHNISAVLILQIMLNVFHFENVANVWPTKDLSVRHKYDNV